MGFLEKKLKIEDKVGFIQLPQLMSTIETVFRIFFLLLAAIVLTLYLLKTKEEREDVERFRREGRYIYRERKEVCMDMYKYVCMWVMKRVNN